MNNDNYKNSIYFSLFLYFTICFYQFYCFFNKEIFLVLFTQSKSTLSRVKSDNKSELGY
jgi:hypothetical protein